MDYGGMGGMRTMITQAPIPVNPDVKLKHLPFYDVLGELMKPSSLSKYLNSTFNNCHGLHLTLILIRMCTIFIDLSSFSNGCPSTVKPTYNVTC